MAKDLQNLKLGDLNVSKLVKNDFAQTQTGTPFYASPEVWREDPYDFKTDIWSLGCVMFEICMLKPPFKGQTIQDLYQKVNQCKHVPFDSLYSM